MAVTFSNPLTSGSREGYRSIDTTTPGLDDENEKENAKEGSSTCGRVLHNYERPLLFLAGVIFMALVTSTTSHFRPPVETPSPDQSPPEDVHINNPIDSNVAEELAEDAYELAKLHAQLAAERTKLCRNVDWVEACERIGSAGARRRRLEDETVDNFLEDSLLDSDDPSVTYDENCLRLYRLDLEYNMTFPYRANQLLRAGGKQTMTLFIQHGAMRDADHYFCSFRQLMMEQDYRPFNDILVIAPHFEYKSDSTIYPYDAFWNSTKPWGDWRVGAQSDPKCCGNKPGTGQRTTISSFDVMDQMLAILTNRELYPNMNKISILGHSAGGQMVQRYAIMSLLAAAYDEEDIDWMNIQFVVANPSSYTYLDDRRFSYNCGHCRCNSDNCTCPQSCSVPSSKLTVPSKYGVGRKRWPCFDSSYNNWPYGLKKFADPRHMVPYVIKSGPLRAAKSYYRRNMIYLVGQNDTCNDGLPTCHESCWKRDDYLEDEWPCFRNHMDTRCPAMLEGPYRRIRGQLYMKYLEKFYGKPTHKLYIVPGIGHNATGMFGSEIGLRTIFS